MHSTDDLHLGTQQDYIEGKAHGAEINSKENINKLTEVDAIFYNLIK